jgi:hypothetical protein
MIGRSSALPWTALILAFAGLAQTARAAADKPAVVGNSVILLEPHDTNGVARVALRNDGQESVTLHLTVSAASDEAQGVVVAIKEQPQNAAAYELAIKPHEAQQISVAVSNVGADDFDVDLLNGADRIGKVAVKHVGFSVHLADPKATINLYEGAPSDVKVTNDDRWAHDVAWRVRLDGRDICGGRLLMAAKRAALLSCTPSFGWPAFTKGATLFRPQAAPDAMLVMDRAGGPAGAPPLAIASLPVSAQYFSVATQQWMNYATVILVLVGGGVASLLLSQVIPNRLKRIEVKDRLEELDRSVSGLGGYVDSSLRVLLRVERRRLADVLHSRASYSPEFAAVAGQCAQGMDRLARRVWLTQQLDAVLRLTVDRETTSSVAPTQAKAARESLERAEDVLRNATPTDAELVTAAQAITSAAQIVDAAAQSDAAFRQAVAARVQSLRTELIPLKDDPEFKRVTAAVPQPLRSVTEAPDVVPETAARSLDSAATKLALIRDYVRHRNGVTDGAKRDRMNLAERALVELLQNSNIASINETERKLQQIRDDIYPQSLITPLQMHQARIEVSPSIVYEHVPLQFAIRFDESAIDRAVAAREEFRCAWDFGDGLQEHGWEVSHYYVIPRRHDGKFTVRATFIDEHGNAVTGEDAKGTTVTKDTRKTNPAELTANIEVRPPRDQSRLGERSTVEVFKLGAALLIAVFGLVAGARDQIAKLDVLPGLIAVFMVGFSADTIKSLLSGKS